MNRRGNVIRKMALTAVMLVLNLIFNRLFMFLSITPFNKIGIADVFTIFTSVYVGPFYGMVVGGFGDMLGALLLPTGAINWLITAAKFVSGALPGLLYLIFKRIQNKKLFKYISYGFMTSICVVLTVLINVFPETNLGGTNVSFVLWERIVFPILTFLLCFLLFFFLHFFEKKFHFESNYDLWFIVIIYELMFPLIINTIIKASYFQVSFIPIFVVQLLLFVVDIVLIVVVLNLLKRVKILSRS